MQLEQEEMGLRMLQTGPGPREAQGVLPVLSTNRRASPAFLSSGETHGVVRGIPVVRVEGGASKAKWGWEEPAAQ